MAVSEVSIANLALQKLGAKRITSLNENSGNARSINSCYEILRNAELQLNTWSFTLSRSPLAASPVAPAFGYSNAFPLPNDFLRLLLPPRNSLDWSVERQGGVRVILTNDGAPLNVRYVALVTDPTQFDPLFCTMLACKIAWNCCEEITQSNTKKADVRAEYGQTQDAAHLVDALQSLPDQPPTDDWDAARIWGSGIDNTQRYMGAGNGGGW